MKQSRNEQCNCGSGKKYKRCCISKESTINLNYQNSVVIPIGDDMTLKQYSVKIDPKFQKELFRHYENMDSGGDCAYSAVLNQSTKSPLAFGNIFLKDNGSKSGKPGFDVIFNYHMFCVDRKNNTIYDDFDNLNHCMKSQQMVLNKPLEQCKIAYIDGSSFVVKDNPNNLVCDVADALNDSYYKDYDIVYVYNLAFHRRGDELTYRYDLNWVKDCVDKVRGAFDQFNSTGKIKNKLEYDHREIDWLKQQYPNATILTLNDLIK